MNDLQNNSQQILAQFTLDALEDSVFLFDHTGKILLVNQGACKNLGYSKSEFSKMSIREIDPEFYKTDWDENWKKLVSLKEMIIESKHVRKDGSTYPAEIRASIIDHEDKKYIYAIARDISEEIKSRETLQVSEEKYRILFESANDAIFIMDGEKFIECNRKTLDIFGLTGYDEIINHPPWEFSPKFQPDGVESYYKAKKLIQDAKNGIPQRFYWKHNKKNKEEFHAEVSLNKLGISKDSNLIQAIVRDISDYIEANEKIKTSEDSLHALINATDDAAILLDASGTILELNDTLAAKYGLNREDILGQPSSEVMSSNQSTTARNLLNQLIQTKKPVKYESEWHGRQYQVKLFPVLNQEEEVDRVAVFERDITEEKLSFLKLQEAEERFHKIFQSSPASIHITTIPEGIFTDVNPMFESLSGFDREELIGKNALEMGFYILEQDRIDLFTQLHEDGRLTGHEIPFRIKSGQIKHCQVYSEIIDFKGIPHLLSMVIDATEQKQIEEAIKQSEHRIRTLIQHTTEAIFCYEYDPPISVDLPLKEQKKRLYDGYLAECNDVCAQIYGARYAEDVIGKKLVDLFGSGVGSLDQMFEAFLHNEYRSVDQEGPEKMRDGSTRWFLNNVHGVVEDGQIKRIWGSFKDITEQVMSREKLQEQEIKFRTLAEHSITGIWHLDAEGRTIYANPAMCKMLEIHSVEEIKGETFHPFYSKKDIRLIEKERIRRRKGEATSYQVTLIGKEGTERPVIISGAPLFDDEGNFTSSIGTVTDISGKNIRD